jgi:hypothetical protein
VSLCWLTVGVPGPLAVYVAVVIVLSAIVMRQARHRNLLAVGYAAGSVLAAATVALIGGPYLVWLVRRRA